jgi:Ca2+-binding EF-hand superfamily protein
MACETPLSARSAWCRSAKAQEQKMGSSISGMGFSGMPSASQMSQMRDKMFGKADANSDGGIDKAEFAKGPQGANGKNSDEAFAKIDADKNGKISKDEMKTFSESKEFKDQMSSQMQSMMVSMQSGGGNMPDMSQLFGDKKDSTSSVSGSNSTQSKQDIKNRIDEMFAKADGDKDGKLSKNELTSLQETMQSQFKTSLLSAQEQSQKAGGTSNDNSMWTQLLNNSSSGSSTGSSDPFTSLMMKQLQAV